MRKLFGTDGIRGVAGEYPLDKKTVYAVGRALGDHLPGDQAWRSDYLNWLARTIAGAERLHIVVDFANGAASTVAPEIFKRSGAHAEFTHRTPDGRNINENCGALHPEFVVREVLARTT